MPGPEDWAEGVRTTSFQLAVEYDLNAKPGKLSPSRRHPSPYSDKMVEVVDRFDDEGGLDNKTARNEDTTYTDPSSTRRWIKKPQTADTAVLIDRDDMKATRVDIKSPMAVRTGNKVRRYHDNQWLNGFFGNAYSDETGSTTVTFDSNNIIAHGSAGLTKAKLITLRQMMLLNDVDIEEEEPILLIDPLSESDLLGITEYANADYNESKPLVRGEIKPWLGFRFVRCNLTSTRAYPDAASAGGARFGADQPAGVRAVGPAPRRVDRVLRLDRRAARARSTRRRFTPRRARRSPASTRRSATSCGSSTRSADGGAGQSGLRRRSIRADQRKACPR
jgi:hypothetical protein